MSAPNVTSDSHNAYEQNLRMHGYEPLPEFAILDECDFHDKRTGQDVKFDKQRLTKLAKEHNRLIEETDSPPVICVGHTKERANETEQPPVVGVATRFTVKNLKNGKAAVFVKPWAKPGQTKAFKDNPYRSVELFLNPDAVHPIALLGPTAPRRDSLGYHLFSRYHQYDGPGLVGTSGSVIRFSRFVSEDGRRPILFSMGDESMASPASKCDDEKTPVKTDDTATPAEPTPSETPGADAAAGDPVLAKLFESDQWKKLQAEIQTIMAFVQRAAPIFDGLEQEAVGGPTGGPPGGPPGAPQGPPPGPPADANAPASAPGGPPAEEPRPDRGGGDDPDKKNFAGSAPGYGNVMMPNQHFDRYYEPYYYRTASAPAAPATPPVQMATAERVTKLENDLKAVLAKNDELVKTLAKMKMEAIETETNAALVALQQEGYAVKLEIDGPALYPLTPEKRAEAIQFMRDTRAKSDTTPLPGGGKPVVDRSIMASAPGQPVKMERDQALGFSMRGDPGLAAEQLPDDWETLSKIPGMARAQGVNVKDFDIRQLFGQPADNGVKVR